MVKILFVDDDHLALQLMKRVAEICGCEAIICSSGLAALMLIEVEKPDLIMLDLNLQDIHGIKFINLLRRNKKIAKTPVVVLSAEKFYSEEVTKKLSEADGYIHKPLRLDDLPLLIEKYVNKRKSKTPSVNKYMSF